MASCSPTTTIDQELSTTISTVHPDIIQTHILTRLDGQALAAIASTSSQLRSLSTHEQLWQDICNSTWHSTKDSHVQTLISTFPGGHRSFFFDSFPALDSEVPPSKHSTRDCSSVLTTELISAVDIYYQNYPVLSKVVETDTVTGWFQFPPFRIDLLDEKELVPTPVIIFKPETDVMIKQLEENLTLSWILIDSGSKRAVNLSSRWPVSVQQHWLTRDVHVKYAAIIVTSDRPWGLFSTAEFAECEVVVTLGAKEGGEMYVREVTMQMKDMEERNISGRESLAILQRSIASGKRKRGTREIWKERYEGFLEMKIESKKRKQRTEKVLNIVCVSTCFVVLVAFWSYKLLKIYRSYDQKITDCFRN